MKLDLLSELYKLWVSEQALEPISADELLAEGSLCPSQERWLEAFIMLWEDAINE